MVGGSGSLVTPTMAFIIRMPFGSRIADTRTGILSLFGDRTATSQAECILCIAYKSCLYCSATSRPFRATSFGDTPDIVSSLFLLLGFRVHLFYHFISLFIVALFVFFYTDFMDFKAHILFRFVSLSLIH